ncbi:YciI family protein [Flaviaesturariibacter flavus]|nr:YciI family protein [Flaviaesturariibacter flavus]
MNTRLTPEAVMARVQTGRPYVLLLLKAGRDPMESENFQELQMGHLMHLFGLEAEGKAHIFGPVTTEGDLKGIIVFGTADKDEVSAWMQGDPLCNRGIFVYELYDWFSIPGMSLPVS